jgi:hypothetical protein
LRNSVGFSSRYASNAEEGIQFQQRDVESAAGHI